MASTQALEPPRPFYCHQCSHQWMKAQDSLFECPRCQEGFIEEVSDDFNPNVLFLPAASPLEYFLQQALSGDEDQRNRSRARRNRLENHRPPSEARSRSPHISNIVIGARGDRPGILLHNHRDHRDNFASRFLSVAIDDIMSFIFTSERQTAMTQEQLNAIPLATITSEQVEAQLQCAICFEDFQLNENEVRKLLCNHFFHEKCIFPWLRNNASCPICRTSLAGDQSDTEDDSIAFIAAATANSRTRRPRIPFPERSGVSEAAGPSTSSAAHQPSSSRSMRSRIPIRRSRFLNDDNLNIQATPDASTTRPNRAMLFNPSFRIHRQQALRQEENARINLPISSRTRSQQRRDGELLSVERRQYRPRRAVPSNSFPSALSYRRPINNNNSSTDNNNERAPMLPPRRRRNAIYVSPTARRRNRVNNELFRDLISNMNGQRVNIDSDSSSFDSDMIVDESPAVVLDSDD